MLRPLGLGFEEVLETWIPERLKTADTVPLRIIGWLKMSSRVASSAGDAALELYTDGSETVLLVHEPPTGPFFVKAHKRIAKVALWVSDVSKVDLKLLFDDVLKEFAVKDTLFFAPLDTKFLPFLQASRAKLWFWEHNYHIWKATPNSYTQRDPPDGTFLDTVQDKDLADIMRLSTVPYSHQYLERLIRSHPFKDLNSVLREREGGQAMSWALSHEGFSIALVGTKEEHRGKGFGYFPIADLLHKQRRHGLSEGFAFIATDNTSSQKLFSRAGFECLKETEFAWCTADLGSDPFDPLLWKEVCIADSLAL